MLLRVAQSASRFPLHIVAIYTSTGARAVKMLILTIWLSLSFTFFPFLQSLFISSQLTSPYFTVPLLSPFLLSQHLLHSYLPPLSTPYLYSPFFSSLFSSLNHFLPLFTSTPHSSFILTSSLFTTPLLTPLQSSLPVVECQRAGLKSSAYNYAVMLMSPDYRQHIEASIKKKIEAVVRRKSQQEEEAAEELSMCPISMYAHHMIILTSALTPSMILAPLLSFFPLPSLYPSLPRCYPSFRPPPILPSYPPSFLPSILYVLPYVSSFSHFVFIIVPFRQMIPLTQLECPTTR